MLEPTTARSSRRESRGLKIRATVMAGTDRRAHPPPAGMLGLALIILIGMATEGSSWILGVGTGSPIRASLGSTHRATRQQRGLCQTMMIGPSSRGPVTLSAGFKGPAAGEGRGMPAGILCPMEGRQVRGCLGDKGQGRGAGLPHRLPGGIAVAMRGVSRPGEGGGNAEAVQEGEGLVEVAEDGRDGGAAREAQEAASAMVENVRRFVREGSPRKCMGCLDALAEEADIGEDGKALVVEAVLRGLVKLSRFDLVADAWKTIKNAGLPASDHIATVVVKAMCRSQTGGVWTAMQVISELEERKSGSWKDVYPAVCQVRLPSLGAWQI